MIGIKVDQTQNCKLPPGKQTNTVSEPKEYLKKTNYSIGRKSELKGTFDWPYSGIGIHTMMTRNPS